jgi:DNA-binding response OmpR family regulator
VLVIDDDHRVRGMFCDFLNSLGYQVDPAENGAEALNLLGRREYDLVITDLVMPGMTGLEVAASVRRGNAGTPIIVISGSVTPEDEAQIRDQRLRFLAKPLRFRDFAAAIHLALDGAQ